MAARNYRRLTAWQKAMDLATGIYDLTRSFPDNERFGLVLQLRRAAVSIASNIAEGEGRGNDNEFIQFLRIAHGSLQEVETQLYLAHRLHLADEQQTEPLLELAGEVGRLINGLLRSLREH